MTNRRENAFGVLLAVVIGLIGYGIYYATDCPAADPLVLSMIGGICVGTIVERRARLRSGFDLAPKIFLPFGLAFYGLANLTFDRSAGPRSKVLLLAALIIIVYFAVVLLLGKLLSQHKQITYLTATGSAICGASAIVVTSPTVKAESDDVSISLLAVTFSAIVGLFMILPFLATSTNITNRTYALLSGTVLQMTGFVETAARSVPFLPEEVQPPVVEKLALSIKSTKYLALLVAVPVLSSLARRKFSVPWVLWVYLAGGIAGTVACKTQWRWYETNLVPLVGPAYSISWSVVMAAVGLNADVRELLSNRGMKALIMAFAGFCAAIITFFAGSAVFGLF